MSQHLPTNKAASDFSAQLIAVVASITAAMCTIVANTLTKRFPLSFHASTPRWKYVVIPLLCFTIVYAGLLIYASLSVDRLSTVLAFMGAPSVPVHGFLWALIPQRRNATEAPSTDRYLRQCFERKSPLILAVSYIPLVLSIVLAGVSRAWQALVVQVATTVTFMATGSTPEMIREARENSFGRAGRHIMLPRPGMRDDTIAYPVDLQEETLLDPVRVSMAEIAAYKTVGELAQGRGSPVLDDARTTEIPVAMYLDSFVSRVPLDKLSGMTTSLNNALEGWKTRLTEPVMDIFLLYGLVERMGYVAFRPSTCTIEQRGILMMYNFDICVHDSSSADEQLRTAAAELRAKWQEKGEELLKSDDWRAAHESGSNTVDLDVPEPGSIVQALQDGHGHAERLVQTIGSVVHFLEHVLGHDEEMLRNVVKNVPYYHNRISLNVGKYIGNIPLICRGMLSSMKRGHMLSGSLDDHHWASSGDPLRWGAAGYALLDQAYARNSAIAYVVQLAIIVIKAVLEN